MRFNRRCFQFEGAAGEEFQEQASQLCCLQSQAQELIKNKKRKDPRFAQLIQVHKHPGESNMDSIFLITVSESIEV